MNFNEPGQGKSIDGAGGDPRRLVLVGLTALGLYLCYRMALPFLAALVWALTLAILAMPVQRWVERRVKKRGLAAALTVLAVALVTGIAATFVVQRLVVEAANGVLLIHHKVEAGEWQRLLEANPRVAPAMSWIGERIDLPGTLGEAASWLTNSGASLLKGSVVQLIGIILTLYLLFFFLRDRGQALEGFRDYSPLRPPEMDRLFVGVADTVHATVYGTMAVAAVQGLLGGLMFWWLGLAAPLLWGIMMGLLAIIPVLGAFIIWIPAAIFLALEGSWGKALILTFWGAVVVGGIDNLLYPFLVGNRLKLHTLLAFFSVVGGLAVFGASGLVLGPVALTVTLQLLAIWKERVNQAQSKGSD